MPWRPAPPVDFVLARQDRSRFRSMTARPRSDPLTKLLLFDKRVNFTILSPMRTAAMKRLVAIGCLMLLDGVFGSSGFRPGAVAAALHGIAGDESRQAGAVAPPDDSPCALITSPEQGLSSPEVWSVLRDHRGFMWFGTLDGLNRYDGYTMKVFTHDLTDPASLSDNKIRTLYEDRAGALWIGTWTGGLDRFRARVCDFYSLHTRPRGSCQSQQRQRSMPF